MKKTMILLAALALYATGSNAQATSDQPKTVNIQNEAGTLTFEEENWEFGNLSEGPDVTHEFKLRNTGTKPVIIANAAPGCGCTVANWPKEPIMPGAEASIGVTYHTKGRVGAFTKMVTVTSDADRPSIALIIKGTVASTATAASATPAH